MNSYVVSPVWLISVTYKINLSFSCSDEYCAHLSQGAIYSIDVWLRLLSLLQSKEYSKYPNKRKFLIILGLLHGKI